MSPTKREFKDVLKQIKNKFGLEPFKDQRVIAYFKDIEPNNKSDITMLKLLNDLKIINTMVDLENSSRQEKKSFLTTALLLLVEQNFIQDKIAQQYLEDLTEVFNWENFSDVFEAFVLRNKSNSRELIQKEIEDNEKKLNQIERENNQFLKEFNYIKETYDLKSNNFNSLRNDLDNDHDRLINIRNELYDTLAILENQSDKLVIISKDLNRKYSKQSLKDKITQTFFNDFDDYYLLLVKYEKLFNKLNSYQDQLKKISNNISNKKSQLVRLRNEMIPIKENYEAAKFQYNKKVAELKAIENKIDQLKKHLSELPVY